MRPIFKNETTRDLPADRNGAGALAKSRPGRRVGRAPDPLLTLIRRRRER